MHLIISNAVLSVLQEREKQMNIKGYDVHNDDAYRHGELSLAASCYALDSGVKSGNVPVNWPFEDRYWRASTRRRNLVKAAALIIAELESLDRKQTCKTNGDKKDD